MNKRGKLTRGLAVAGALAAIGLVADAAPAKARVYVHVGVGVPVYPYYRGYPYAYPYYYAPPPVYYYPPPAYYYPPPVAYAPPPPAPVVVQNGQSCTNGKWRQQDGSVVDGVACRQADGSWRME